MGQQATPAPMPFSRWMELALFHPEKGYYSRKITGIGRHGDFSTSATINDTLASAIASWIKAKRKDMPDVTTIIEVGGGDGSLGAAVIDGLGWWTRRKLKFFIVERSPVLREQQQAKIGHAKAQWFEHMEDALAACHGYALIFHNELLDAFPVTLVQWSAERRCWEKVYLDMSDGTARETLKPLAWYPIETDSYSVLREWTALKPPPHPEQRCELSKSAFEWIQNWSYHWKRGTMLTIDYGDAFPSLYDRRPLGTLRAYLMHQRLTGLDIYANMGRQDVTADVNFSDLVHWGRLVGWTHQPLKTQRDFIKTFAPQHFARGAADKGIAFLIDPEGAGTAFKVLEQQREPGTETRRMKRPKVSK